MRVVVLSKNRFLYSTRRLVAACAERGIAAAVIDPLHVVCDLAANDSPFYDEREGNGALHLIPRVAGGTLDAVSTIARMCLRRGVSVVNAPPGLTVACDKAATCDTLARVGIPTPPSILLHSTAGLAAALERLGGPPIIAKSLHGSQGRGVMLLETLASTRSVCGFILESGEALLLQRFVAEARGRDIRLFVIGGEVAAAMRREAPPGEFRANVHQGGKTGVHCPSVSEREIALRAVKAVGLDYAGVDILESADGPLVVEVNASPGLEGIERVSGLDLAGMLLDRLGRF